jgi:DNA-directed RNA polymerase specialized sigma24 family protein
VLRHVLDYEYAEIGGMLSIGEANCRQIFRRAKLRLGEVGARYQADPRPTASSCRPSCEP